MAPTEAVPVKLRGVSIGDAPAVTRLLEGDVPLALQTATIPIPYSLENARHFLSTADPERIFAITVGGDLVGMIGMIGSGETVEIGYWIGRKYWRKGYAAAAVALLMEQARLRGVSRLVAEVFPDNLASMRVLEKNGFVRVGEVNKDLPQRGGLRLLIRFRREL